MATEHTLSTYTAVKR